jgi:uncharacterized protein (DUF488 family)
MKLFTIGHSTRAADELIALLKSAGVDLLVDVRTVPRSRTNPQFNGETLPETLATAGIGYRHMKALGGLRGRQKLDGPSPNTYWRNDSFRNYADYALTPGFRAGLDELRGLAGEHTCAVMCAETLWWRCHRRIITDYLIAAGDQVVHILGPDKTEPGRLAPEAEPQADGSLRYPAAQGTLL